MRLINKLSMYVTLFIFPDFLFKLEQLWKKNTEGMILQILNLYPFAYHLGAILKLN